MSFQPDDPIWVPDPDREGRLAAIFVAPGEPGEAEVDPALDVARDIAWITYEEGDCAGETAKLFYREISLRES